MQQKMLYILLTCLVFSTGLIIPSVVVYSEAYTIVNKQTGKYLDSLGTNQPRQTSVNYQFEQHGSQYSKDSMNHRNNQIAHHGNHYVQDSMNKRSNPGGKYYVPQKLNHPDSNVTSPHETAVTIQIKDW